ncbi:helix-turn-helix domain-containing protein [Streptomyces sp. Rer75]|uniref:helix-turn-helix domain-containing protein n=3 Tax=unclassified Streptomyces TaxID=2593676 RepID=UPI0007C5B67B|nr:helix-turn-helix domain-containing protein [Streptomyces sp. Rer75]QLH20526.1 helix-turn-helix domain-containing protein [Streptomyces sp. Rer75]
MNQPMWTVSALADYLGKPVSWVYDNHAKEAIPSFRVGQQLRFSPTEIETWLESKCRESATA